MNRDEIKRHLRSQPFEPFDIVSSSGGRYRVRHPELTTITARGTIFVFEPVKDDE